MTRATESFIEGMLRKGRPVQWIADASGWQPADIEQVAQRINVCTHDTCGHPQTGPGHPKTGWIRIHQAGRGAGAKDHRWFCSWRCAIGYATRQLVKETA